MQEVNEKRLDQLENIEHVYFRRRKAEKKPISRQNRQRKRRYNMRKS